MIWRMTGCLIETIGILHRRRGRFVLLGVLIDSGVVLGRFEMVEVEMIVWGGWMWLGGAASMLLVMTLS